MIIPNSVFLPFIPGHTFWSPRVRSQSELVSITHEGHEYTRRQDILHASAKHKRITKVEIIVSETGQIRYRYWAVTVNQQDGLATLCNPYLGFGSETAAVDFARYWRDTQGTEYHGETTLDLDINNWE